MMSRRLDFLGCAALAAVCGTATAGDPPPIFTLVIEGDAVAGVGNVTRIDNIAVNDAGAWYVEADTDFGNSDQDQVLLNGLLDGAFVLFLREDDPLAEPAGARLDSFDSININAAGNSGWNFFLDGTSGSSDNSGIYFVLDLVIQESEVTTAPGLTPGTPYIGFFDAKINAGDQIMLVASIDDPAISSSVDRALIRVDNPGGVYTETLIAKESDELLPGRFVSDFGTGPHQSAFNNNADNMYFADLDGDSATDGTIWINMTLLAQEGTPSPVAGRTYQFLSSRGMDLNDLGGYVHKANLDGDTADDDLIVMNGMVFVREGDSLPAFAPFQLTSLGTGSGPVQIDNGGNVLWYGDWDDPDTSIDSGLFLNDELLVQEGVTTIGGLVVDTISNGSDAFDLSDDGRFAIFEATLEGGLNGAFLIQLVEEIPAFVDIRTGACPNPFNRNGRGVLPINVLGTADFDVTQIDLSTVALSRADGVGGSVAPNEGPPGPHSVYSDTGTPFEGEACDCIHAGADGILDLRMKFRTDDMVAGLMLDDLPLGTDLELVVSGALLDGTAFAGSDCVRIVPPGASNLMVESTWSDLYVQLDTPDLNLDDDGFAPFARCYADGTTIHLRAPATQMRRQLSILWIVDGQPYSTAPTIALDVGSVSQVQATYIPRPSSGPWIDLAGQLNDLR
ncbi:MAG: DUF7453 family protein [Planctomycetota bacterium]|jgi:hypothetical protein